MTSTERTAYQQLTDNLEFLKLQQIHEQLPEITDRVQKRELSFVEALLMLTNAEADKKKLKTLSNALQTAGFPHLKKLKNFDFDFQPAINKNQIYDLATLNFVARQENVIFLGSPGVGKTHLATALGVEGAAHGYATYFIKASELLNKLRRAKDENRLESQLKMYQRYKILIIDELGFLPIQQGNERLLFQLIDMRYEKRSTIVTSNIQFSDWGNLFEDPRIANAILDRLLHHAHVVTILGDSYRLKNLIQESEVKSNAS